LLGGAGGVAVTVTGVARHKAVAVAAVAATAVGPPCCPCRSVWRAGRVCGQTPGRGGRRQQGADWGRRQRPPLVGGRGACRCRPQPVLRRRWRVGGSSRSSSTSPPVAAAGVADSGLALRLPRRCRREEGRGRHSPRPVPVPGLLQHLRQLRRCPPWRLLRLRLRGRCRLRQSPAAALLHPPADAGATAARAILRHDVRSLFLRAKETGQVLAGGTVGAASPVLHRATGVVVQQSTVHNDHKAVEVARPRQRRLASP
jgi:hypothetical protein